MKKLRPVLVASILGTFLTPAAFATNPLILDQFTADPTARVFDGRVYVYPSHDIREPPGYTGRPNWFVMEDYHVYSSANLTDWTDHGVILTQKDVPWADPTGFAMWAPDCVFKDGKYYFYFPAKAKDGSRRMGVAVADSPAGPFKPEANYIQGVAGIDPGLFLDKDGSAYMYWSEKDALVMAKLKPNMLEIDGEPRPIDNLPKKGLQEGPFVFERKGVYYLTYPHVANKIERLEYATSASPMGPFKWAGVFLDESESGCWTSHHSFVEYQGQWYLFYHDRDLSPDFDKRRAIRADKLYFNDDGSIRQGDTHAARRRGRECREPDPDRPLQRAQRRCRGRIVSRRCESACRLEDRVQRRAIMGAVQRGRLRPRRTEDTRGTRQSQRQGSARDPAR